MPEATQRFFDHQPESVRAARDFTTRTLASWGLDDTGDIRLVVSELATNALAHGSDDEHGFLVRLEPSDGGIRLEVHDSRDPHEPPPVPAVPEPAAETGRGLVIVDALAARWGVARRRPFGKVVWSYFPAGRRVSTPPPQGPSPSLPPLIPREKDPSMDHHRTHAPHGTFTIGKTFVFETGHRLPGLPPEHKCSRQHGHGYEVEVILTAAELEEPGFVTDFGALAPFKKFLDTELDHHNLHEVLDFEPTSERLARFLADWFIEHVQPGIHGRLVAVQVRGAARSWARFEVAS
ncbi:6-carboxytetrahydropterin synthase [Streptomyces sp. NPDC014861]|uniref:6-carboxytetrahydropterin synthase n=1 Tax=Streptomyces sp. NPDC014861 TaxID=3364923 RepID=UPI003701DE71